MESVDLTTALEKSKIILENYKLKGLNLFLEYDKCYLFATEYIKDYLKKERYNPKAKALTVIGSGDQIFNLIHNGAIFIDGFDINRLTYYLFYLRLSMLKNLSLKEFIAAHQILSYPNHINIFASLFSVLKKDLPIDVQEYYSKIIEFCQKEKGFIDNLYFRGSLDLISINNYLQNEESYKKTQNNLNECAINLHFADVNRIPNILTGPYEIIILSNIIYYVALNMYPFKLNDFNEYIAKFKEMLKPEGILINYLYGLNHNDKEVILSKGSFLSNESITPRNLGLDNIVWLNYPDLSQGYYRIRKRTM